jgi:hypothetical protein
MNARTDRLLPALGVAAVVLSTVGLMIGGKLRQLTVSSSTSSIAHQIAHTASLQVWVGAYLALLGAGCLVAFLVWAPSKLGGGTLAAVARGLGVAYATVGVASYAVSNTIAYRAGHGLDVGTARTLVTLNESFFVVGWFLAAFFLVAAGALALRASRRGIGWSAIALAAYTLAAAPSVEGVGQASTLVFFVWIVCTGIALARRPSAAAARVPAVQHG